MPRKSGHGLCATCGRELPLTFHHLIPRCQHRRRWCQRRYTREQMQSGIDVCADCHGAFHRFATERELADRFSTPQALMTHPEIGKFVRWVSGRAGRFRTRRPRR